MLDGFGSLYRPEDAYIGDLLSAWSALDAVVTTVLDWAPDGSGACLARLPEGQVKRR